MPDPTDPTNPTDPTRVSITPVYPTDPASASGRIQPDPDAPPVVTSTTTTPGEPPVVTTTYTPPPPPPEVRVETTERRGGAGWLLPLLLLLGLGLLAWYFLSRRDSDGTELPPMDAPRVEVARKSGSRLLDRAAVDAVRKWRFSPAMQDGRKIAAAVEVPVDFVASEYR